MRVALPHKQNPGMCVDPLGNFVVMLIRHGRRYVMNSRKRFGWLLSQPQLVSRMQMPPQFALGSAIFFEHVEVAADHHGNCFGLQLIHDMIKYTKGNAIYHGGNALALLWACPHQFNGDFGLRSNPWYTYGMRLRSLPGLITYSSCSSR